MKLEFETGQISQVSDGFHTFEELYYYRMVLFSIICNQNHEHAYNPEHSQGLDLGTLHSLRRRQPETKRPTPAILRKINVQGARRPILGHGGTELDMLKRPAPTNRTSRQNTGEARSWLCTQGGTQPYQRFPFHSQTGQHEFLRSHRLKTIRKTKHRTKKALLTKA